MKVTPKLTEDLKKPFKLEGIQRIDETPVHKAVREAFVNQIIHADYLSDAGTLKVIKRSNEFEFTNPGILKLPVEDIYRGGNSKSRNPRMQTMLRMGRLWRQCWFWFSCDSCHMEERRMDGTNVGRGYQVESGNFNFENGS